MGTSCCAIRRLRERDLEHGIHRSSKVLSMKSVQVGDRVPDLTLTAHDGRKIPLSASNGTQTIVLFFYPADNSPICTAEACAFRDAYQDFVEAGATVIGISGDTETTHSAFARAQNLPYALVSDPDGSLRRAFGVSKGLGFLPGRVTYVIDGGGIVRHVVKAQFVARKHMQEALRIVRILVQQEHRNT
jgi:thioredoxin-dependent peroxiredoxin